MKNRKKAYRSSIILSLACTAVMIITTILIVRPSILQGFQHRIYHMDNTQHALSEVPAQYAHLVNPKRNYNLAEILAGNDELILSDLLILVSPQHPLPHNYSADLLALDDTELLINKYGLTAFKNLSAEIQAQFSEKLYINYAYLSPEDLTNLQNPVPNPHEDEHSTGLALDVQVNEYPEANFINHPIGKWLNEHAADYGFIIRYPRGREDVTGITYRPWQLRYVSLPHSKILRDKAWVLEEYLQNLQADRLYFYDNFFIYKTQRPSFDLPAQSKNLFISPDNTGYYVLWGELEELN